MPSQLIEDDNGIVYPLDDMVRSHCHVRIRRQRCNGKAWIAGAQPFPLPERLRTGGFGRRRLHNGIDDVALAAMSRRTPHRFFFRRSVAMSLGRHVAHGWRCDL